MKISVCKTFQFDAAHFLPNYEGKCKNLHGHTWLLEVEVSLMLPFDLISEGPKQGMVIDFGDLKEVVQREVIDKLDHTLLNDVIENPTAENILLWIERVLGSFGEELCVTRLRLYETPGSFAELKL